MLQRELQITACVLAQPPGSSPATRAYNTASPDKSVGTPESGGGAVLGDLIGAEAPAIEAVVDRQALRAALKHLGPATNRFC